VPIQIQFYTFKERQPANGQEIVMVRDSKLYSTWEFEFARIEYQWEEFDETGFTGTSYSYEEGEPQPENTVLVVLTVGGHRSGGFQAPDDALWTDCKEVEGLLHSEVDKP
jgi:hypothetical protein